MTELLDHDSLGPIFLAAGPAERVARARFVAVAVLPVGLARDRLLGCAERLQGATTTGLAAVVDIVHQPEGVWLMTDGINGVAMRTLLERPASSLHVRAALHQLLCDSLRGCMALHSMGFAHGAVGTHSIIADAAGRVFIEDPGLSALVLGHPVTAAGDGVAWAGTARAAAQVRIPAGDRYGDAIGRASTAAEQGALRAALEELERGAGAFAAGWQDRAALRGLVTAP